SASSNQTLTITPATLTVTAKDASKVYGQPNPSFSAAITGFVNGENASVVSGSASLTTNATTSSGVGTYTITAALGSLTAANYTFTFVNGTLTVTQAELTVTGITANNKVYDRTTAATLNLGNAQFQGVLGSDQVTLDSSGYTAAFASANVANGIA